MPESSEPTAYEQLERKLDDLLVMAVKIGNLGALGLAVNVSGPMKEGYDRVLALARQHAEERTERLTEALRQIRNEEGKVCEVYEECVHPACDSSYRSWATADAALRNVPSPTARARAGGE